MYRLIELSVDDDRSISVIMLTTVMVDPNSCSIEMKEIMDLYTFCNNIHRRNNIRLIVRKRERERERERERKERAGGNELPICITDTNTYQKRRRRRRTTTATTATITGEVRFVQSFKRERE